jgi:TolB-like protein/Flp pilus assembly protein TadD
MFTDMVGYSALAQKDEALALRLLEEHRSILRRLFAKHNGREVDAVGDGFFVEFPSALEGVLCAVAIQEALAEHNTTSEPERRFQLRIGLHLGDVVVQDGRVQGDGVNIAARIEPLAPPGGICISEDVARQIENKIKYPLRKLGKADLKNIRLPAQIYRLALPWEPHHAPLIEQTHFWLRRSRSRHILLAAMMLLAGVLAVSMYAFWSPSDSPAPRSPDTRRVAVLPFANLSADPETEYFADGITEEMISQLSKIHGLEVIARTSIMTYKGKDKKIDEIGRELQVGTVLEGSVRKAENHVRITTQLIDVATQAHLWSQDYDRELKGVFAVQSEIANSVTAALKVKLNASEREQIEKKETDSVEAHEAYLKGLYHLNKGTKEGFERSLEYFEQALEHDREYAEAYARLAFAHELQGWYGLVPEKEAFAKAKAFALKSLELDSSNATALTVLGDMSVASWDWAQAEAFYQRALSLKPNSASLHEGYGLQYLSAMGRHEEAIAALKRAVVLDPLSAQYPDSLGWGLLLARQYDAAIVQFEKALQMEPSMAIAYRGLGECYAYKGMHEKAIEALQSAVKSSDGSPFFLGALGWAYGVAGRKEDARKILEVLQQKAKAEPVAPSDYARIYLGLGDKDQTFHWLERTYEERSGVWLLVWAKQFPFFDGLRGEPRFKELLRRIRLEG